MTKHEITWEQSVLWLRSQPDQQELVRACYYDDPLLETAKRYANSEEWQAVEMILPAIPGSALDLGAGRGISSYAMARLGWQVDALEPDASPIVGRGAILSLAHQSGLSIHPLDGFAEAIPCEDDQFDLVFGRQVMHHAKDLSKMCTEIKRVLKPGGVFVATREHVISKKEDLPKFLSQHALHHLYGGENAFLLKEYLSAITNAGLDIKHILGPSDSPINYFPISRSEWKYSIEGALSHRIGKQLTTLLLAESQPWSNQVYHWLGSLATKRDQTPGRLYSFVTQKP